MKSPLPFRASLIALLGLGEAATGAALLGAPGLVSTLLDLSPPLPSEALPIVGAFVLSVGLALLGGVLADTLLRDRKLPLLVPGVLGSTAIARLCVASTLGIGFVFFSWGTGWLLVAAYDFLAAIVQLVLLRQVLDPKDAQASLP